MLTLLSVLVLLGSVAVLTANLLNVSIPKYLSYKLSLILFLISGFLWLSDKSVFFAREGHLYYTLTPFGTRDVISTPGIKAVFPLTTVQEWEKFIDIKAIKVNKKGEAIESVDGIEGPIMGGIKVRYIDKVNAYVFLSVRFEIPNDKESFIRLVETYRHPKNLINNVLIPTITEQLTNVTFMYSADDYVSGAATDYKMTIEDALKNGGFVVRRIELIDTLFSQEILTPSDNVLETPRKISEIRKLTKNEKVLINGIPKRNPHEINVNNIITASVIISDVKLEKKFEEKLTEQRDISAQKIIEIQKVETARAAQQRIVAEGERDKAKERVAQETNQVKKLIAIETQVKEEESKRQLAEISLRTTELNAKSTKIEADAKYYMNSKLVQAGLTPKEKIDAEVQMNADKWEAIKTVKLPETVIMGSNSGQDGLLTNLIGAELAKSMNKK
jgi:hypothetical protein